MIVYRNVNYSKAETQEKGRIKYLIDNNEYYVEEAAILEYKKLGYNALWSENYYWWEIMVLLFWDIIYAKIDGVWSPEFGDFPSALQDMPRDLFTLEFYQRREKIIENRIKELYEIDIVNELIKSHKCHYDTRCRLIEKWEKFTIEELITPIRICDKNKLIEILKKLLFDFKNNRSGLPDLIIHSDKELFFSEVKSENDKVSEKQISWHNYLSQELGFKIEIFLINYSDKKADILKNNNRKEGKHISEDKIMRKKRLVEKQQQELLVANKKNVQAYKKAGIKKMEWLAAIDDTTCPICAALNGKIADVGGEFPGGFKHPPACSSCRCTTVAVVEHDKICEEVKVKPEVKKMGCMTMFIVFSASFAGIVFIIIVLLYCSGIFKGL